MPSAGAMLSLNSSSMPCAIRKSMRRSRYSPTSPFNRSERWGTNGVWFRVSDGDGRSIPSCDDFLFYLRLRDCSAYTLRAYAIGLAHFFSWLHDASESLEHVTRQIISRYITDFSQSERQGA